MSENVSDIEMSLALIRAKDVVGAPLREALAGSGISEAQWRVLRLLDVLGPQTARDIAANAEVLPPSFTRISASLIEAGLVIRARNNKDQRSKYFAISAIGRDLLARHLATIDTAIAKQRAKLGEAEYQRLLSLLEKLVSD